MNTGQNKVMKITDYGKDSTARNTFHNPLIQRN